MSEKKPAVKKPVYLQYVFGGASGYVKLFPCDLIIPVLIIRCNIEPEKQIKNRMKVHKYCEYFVVCYDVIYFWSACKTHTTCCHLFSRSSMNLLSV